jgi:fibronectin type 3 domain-containing protein
MREFGRGPRIIAPILLAILALGVAGRYELAGRRVQGQATTPAQGPATLPAGPRSVHLNWPASPSQGTTGYNVFRSNASGVGYVKLNTKPVMELSYVDTNVASGRTYYYAVTAVDDKRHESTYSKEFVVKVP